LGIKALEELATALRQLVITVEKQPASKPLSDTSLLLSLEKVCFRISDGLLPGATAAKILEQRLGLPDVQVEVLSAERPINLSRWVPDDLTEQTAKHWDKLKDLPIEKIDEKSAYIGGIKLMPLLTSRLRFLGVKTFGQVLCLNSRISYDIHLAMGTGKNVNELISLLRQILP
jgi:hypothetical protein